MARPTPRSPAASAPPAAGGRSTPASAGPRRGLAARPAWPAWRRCCPRSEGEQSTPRSRNTAPQERHHDRRHHHHQRRSARRPTSRPASTRSPSIDISEPRTIYPQTGPNAGKEVQLRDWTFALEDGNEVTGSASTASGPKSKTYAWLTALLGGTPPAVGQSYPKSQLLGREALATITIDEGGWAKIDNLSRCPGAPAAAPVPPPRSPLLPGPWPCSRSRRDQLPF